MKYYIDKKEISKKEADKIKKENDKIMKMVELGLLDFSELMKCKFIVEIA